MCEEEEIRGEEEKKENEMEIGGGVDDDIYEKAAAGLENSIGTQSVSRAGSRTLEIAAYVGCSLRFPRLLTPQSVPRILDMTSPGDWSIHAMSY